MANILVLHGPNLNLLGQREVAIYGNVTLEELNKRLIDGAEQLNHQLTIQQSNAEHVLINMIQKAPEEKIEFIIINPGALAHTSIALRDALLASNIPFIEVHISNTYNREPFRQHSYLSNIARGVIIGLGTQSYELALLACANDVLKQ